MKKSILNLGEALNKAEQQIINGGGAPSGGCRGTKIECYNPITHRWSCQYESNCPW
ncbi:hypothetical protein PG911_14940 [Tenacibaculum ovolyticum]|uniref:hypothetical protein n=1 Tax=Tenacibaculum ovolyticum TaxID=104270 RepID=UPI000AB3EFDD|nr:hypothetical protein [Tenacibaculum ovolyticum]WBX75927.1 hypothetical protein PG911_14940 [Tenacibaculum ovolyticum]